MLDRQLSRCAAPRKIFGAEQDEPYRDDSDENQRRRYCRPILCHSRHAACSRPPDAKKKYDSSHENDRDRFIETHHSIPCESGGVVTEPTWSTLPH